MRTKGKITSWNDEKGYGFITPSVGGRQIFVHISALSNRNRQPEINQLVTYSLSSDKQGRACAAMVTLPGDQLPQKTKRKNGSLSVIAAAFFFAIVGVSVLTAKIPSLILALYIVASLITFTVYAVDKSAAKKGVWRTQESTLHLLSLTGGWPGALVAQQKLRHKSKKESFRLVFWATVVLNLGAFVWLHTPTGSATLQSWITYMVSVLTHALR